MHVFGLIWSAVRYNIFTVIKLSLHIGDIYYSIANAEFYGILI